LSEPADIRTSRLTDGTRLNEILALVHAAFGGFEPPSGVLSETIDDMRRRYRAGPILIAQADGALVGSLFCVPVDDALYLTRLATLPAWRRRGVGSTLLADAEAEARAAGACRLTLRVRVTLPDNQRYLERLGFVVTGQGQDPGRTPYVSMERRLAD